ncbi:MAG: DUF362 domain-containing protein [Candidatus Sericytochromatia bacterium]|nr:DUF362 domain-containing protein [Candidatus Sericytochromatia bacterium]
MGSLVYFAQRRASQGGGLLDKLDAMAEAIGLSGLAAPGEAVAVLTAFGEPGNTTHLRPAYAQRLVRRLRLAGTAPFLTACLPLETGLTRSGVMLLTNAARHGFGAGADDAPLVAADGLRGEAERVVPSPGPHLVEARLGAALVEADALVVLTHVTGHEVAGLGGALAQLGWGGSSRRGKATILGAAPAEGGPPPEAARLVQARLVEAAAALTRGKPGRVVCVNVLMDLTPESDEQPWSDAPFIADVGVLVSRDPVALDQATADLIAQAPGIPGTRLPHADAPDKLRALYPGLDWEHQLEHAEALGLGARTHELLIM